ncbi:MAG: hypothetical protein M4D85_10670, partial [Actinomycetota bacterium]|nr:hypothetical protein [Actinomycetota bacterium]
LLSVLVEAQAGQVETTTAAPCPLRGFSRATVVASSSDAGRLAAAGALLGASAGLVDKLDDGDLPRPVRSPARRVADRLASSGAALATEIGLDPEPVLRAPRAAAEVQQRRSPDLPSLLQPTGDAVAALFAHTAVVAGRPDNAPALATCGSAFGRLVHLLDDVEDFQTDRAAGRFNPLSATGTDVAAARALADALVAQIGASLARAHLVDRALVEVLLGTELTSAVHRAFPQHPAEQPIPAQREGERGAWAMAAAAWSLLAPAVIIGGGWGGGSWGGRRRRRRYYDEGYPDVGYRRIGPGCGQLLACNCCANLACNACCCGNQCANN